MERNFVVATGRRGVPVLLVNTTPHPIRFRDHDGNIVIVPNNPDYLLNAKAVEEQVGDDLVTTRFVGTDNGDAIIESIQKIAKEISYADLRIIGSMIAAQAYPRKVVALTPCPGFERVAPSEKLMSTEKFTIFLG